MSAVSNKTFTTSVRKKFVYKEENAATGTGGPSDDLELGSSESESDDDS